MAKGDEYIRELDKDLPSMHTRMLYDHILRASQQVTARYALENAS